MKWILLWSLVSSYGVSSSSAEFNTLEACQIAAEKTDNLEGLLSTAKAICVEKGEQK